MAKIFIGISSIREDERFLESLDFFLKEISEVHQILVLWKNDLSLEEAQNSIAKEFLDTGFDYLLLLDDDHWGHTLEMLECLINANSYMATIKSYCRHYPYMCCLMRKIQTSNTARMFTGIENGKGYIECDMTGFPMTLLSKDLFRILDKPYFRAEHDGVREWTTDKEFCMRLSSYGIKPIGCFQHCLPHGDITQENIMKFRQKGIEAHNGFDLLNLMNKL